MLNCLAKFSEKNDACQIGLPKIQPETLPKMIIIRCNAVV